MARHTVLTAAVAGVVLAGGLGGYMLLSDYREGAAADDDARAAAEQFARAWMQRAPQNARYVGTDGQGAAANFRTATAALGSGPIKITVGDVRREGSTATADLQVSWTLRNGKPFQWVDPVTLAKSGQQWGVQVGDTSLWHPKLAPNGAFAVRESDAQRGEILGRGGAKLMANQTVYDVKIDPQKATPESVGTLEGVVGQRGELLAKLSAAKARKSEALIPVITYRASDYQPKEDALTGLDGIVVADRQQPLAETRTFGQPLLGTVGPATDEMIKKQPNRYRPGMYVGRSGLQAAFDSTLAPSGGLTVTVAGQPDQVLHGAKPQPGKSLQTTLDPRVQRAAEKAISNAGDSSPAAIVALDVKSGDVLAVANGPSNGINRALAGQYQPGSTLKVSTTYALLTGGFSADTKVPCPPSIMVDGRRIGNFEQETLPADADFRDSFAQSCNTAFVQASSDLAPDAMTTSAKQLGIGVDWTKQLGVPAYTGSVPPTNSKVDHAAESFGQARTLASPLSLAVMAGSVARGSYVPPQLVVQPGTDRTPKPLDGNAIGQIRGMMRQVVTEGTGRQMQGTPGGEVFAKTGTAEFDGADGPESRAWLVGWQGNVAFAVLIETVPLGSGGGDRAAPVAKDFLTQLAQGG